MTNILLVEDDVRLRHLLQRVLQGAEYSVLTATNGSDGLALAQHELPDLILLDLVLPYVDGWTVLHHLKQRERTATIPVIVVTGYTNVNEAGLRAAGCADMLLKPFNITDLLALVARYVDRGRAGAS